MLLVKSTCASMSAPSLLQVLLKYLSHLRTRALLERDFLVLLDEIACCAN